MSKFKQKPSEILRQNHLPQIQGQYMRVRFRKDGFTPRKILGACALGKIALRRGAPYRKINSTCKQLNDIPTKVKGLIFYWNDIADLTFEQIADKLEKEYNL